MKNKNFYLILLSFVVLAAASWLLWQKVNPKSTIDTEDRKFAIEDARDVHKIFMVKRGADPITLERKGDDWFVNGRYKVFRSPISNLLDAMTGMTIKSIPPKAAYEGIMKDLSEIGLKVEIYGKNDKKLKTYYVGGVTNDETGVYFLMDGYRQPYIMHLNKRQSNIRHRFDIALDDWRDRSLVPLDPEEISGVTVSYPYKPEASFTIRQIENSYKLSTPAAPDQFQAEVKSKFLRSYIENLCIAQTENFQNKNPERAEIARMIPFCRIAVGRTGGQDSLIVSLYPINEETVKPVDLSPEFLSRKKFFRFFANRSDGDFLILQIQQISAILKEYGELSKGD